MVTSRMTDSGTLAIHADALEDSSWHVRYTTLQTLRQLDLATLAQHAGAVVARLEDDDDYVRQKALMTLGKLDPATLAQPGITAEVADSILFLASEPAIEIFRALPKVITNNIILVSEDGRINPGGRSRLIGRAAWYRCRLRLRWRRVALYWYALPYRPSGPGHARDVEAWDRMSKRSRHG